MAGEANPDLVIVVGSALLVFLALIIGIGVVLHKRGIREKENVIRLVEKQSQIDILTAVAKAEENQKIKLASHLHDEILAIVNNASTNIAGHLKKLEREGLDLTELKDELKALPQLQDGLRDIIHDILPSLFTSFGLLKAIEVLVNNTKGNGSAAEFHNNTTITGDKLLIPTDDQLLIYKVCREILNNLQKHSGYTFLTVSLEEASNTFVLLFSHNGRSITDAEINVLKSNSPGMGLKLLESKLLLLNAKAEYYKDSATAFVKLSVPIT